jgi:diamine N-acetyltransferase
MLTNNKITLRAVEPQDLELLYSWENNPELWTAGNTRQPFSKFVLKQYILLQTEKDIYESRQLRLMITENEGKKTVGTVDLYDFDIHNSRIALGLYVDYNFQGRGYATEALHLTEEYVFNYLKINQLYCQISVKNTPSRTIFEREGYEQNGRLRNWIKTPDGFEDIIVFQRFTNTFALGVVG